jgi:hypothetical protein
VSGGGAYSGKIFLTLLDYGDNTEVWKTLQTFRFDYYTKSGLYKAGTKFAKQAFQKLLSDQVFLPKKPAKAGDEFI